MDTDRKRETFWRGIERFNRQEFFECHEVLEEIWLEEPPEEKPFYQGIIQIAAAFHHVRNRNLRGARSLMEAGAAKLRRYPAHHYGIDVAAFLTALAPWLDTFRRRQAPDQLALPTIRPAGVACD